MRKSAILITLIISVIFVFSSCATTSSASQTGEWSKASASEIDSFKKEIKALYAGMSASQWDAFIAAIEDATGVTGLARGNPDNWTDAQWAKLYNALKNFESTEGAGGRSWNNLLYSIRTSILGTGTSGTGTSGTSGTGTSGTGTSGTSTAVPPAKYAEGTTGYNTWSMYNRYSNNLDLTGAQTYTVVSGDALFQIANRYYNDAHYYPVVVLANRNQIINPDEIMPGMVLTIPDLQRNLANPLAKQDIKNVILEVSEMRRAEGNTDAANNLRNLANSL